MSFMAFALDVLLLVIIVVLLVLDEVHLTC